MKVNQAVQKTHYVVQVWLKLDINEAAMNKNKCVLWHKNIIEFTLRKNKK